MASAMAAAGRCPLPILVLEGIADVGDLTDEPGEQWVKIKFDSKQAYGCGEIGQKVVEGLKLYARFGEDPVLTSSLAVRMTREALRSIGDSIGFGVHASAVIQIAQDQLLVIRLKLVNGSGKLRFFLVYDSINSSLSLIKCLPDRYKEFSTWTPLPIRTADGASYDLLLLAHDELEQPFLCVCSPDSRERLGLDPNGTYPWQIKAGLLPPEVQSFFFVDKLFSLSGKAFWTDLSQGFLFCNLRHTRCDSVPVVHFSFTKLPDFRENWDLDEEMILTRSVGRVGDSIQYVSIHHTRAIGDNFVKIWTLKLDGTDWMVKDKFAAKTLWKKASFKDKGLSKTTFEFPTMLEDGALCLVLPDTNEDDNVAREDWICCIDLTHMKLMWHGRVRDYHCTFPLILPSSFFQTQHLPSKRKLAEE